MTCVVNTVLRALVLLLVGLPALAAAPLRSDANLPANFHALSNPSDASFTPIVVVEGDPSAVRLVIGSSPLAIEDISLEGENYTQIRISGEGASLDSGTPDVPRVTRLVMVANTGAIGLTVTDQSFTVQPLTHAPAPVQPMDGEGSDPLDGVVAPDPLIYSSDDWYPPQVAEIIGPATLRDVRFVILAVYPVQVNPVTNEMRVYDRIEVAIDDLGGVGENEISITPTSLTPGFKQMYDQFINFPASSLDELPVVPGSQLFICGDNAGVITEVQKLVTWRRRKGIDAYYATTTQSGSTALQIRNYISDQYTQSNGQLEFVTIVGDPSVALPYGLPTEGTQFDNYYGTMGGGTPDPVPDIAVGRLPSSSLSTLAVVVAKTIQYESDPFLTDTTWYQRAWCAAHTNYIPSNPSMKEYTRQIMLQHGMNTVNFDIFPAGIVVSTLETRVNQGICVFNHRLSANNEFYTSDLQGANLTNGRKLPFVMAMTCGTGIFNTEYSISEEWVKRGSVGTPSGAIGCVGMASNGTWVLFNNIIDAGAMSALYVLGIREQGLVLVNGELQLYKNYAAYGHMGDVQNFSYWANLQGDPAVPIWLQVPHAPVVTKPASVNRLTNNITISVAQGGNPVEGALVGLLKGSETFARGYTAADGSINLGASLLTTGYVHVTVTHPGLDSYLDSIQVVNAAASLSFFSNVADDDNVGGTSGDANGILNPGETIDLALRLQNSGTSASVTGITGTLTTPHAGITIVNGTQSYPDIAVGANSVPNLPFRIDVGAVFNNEPISFFLTTTSSVGTQTIRMDLTPIAGDVSFVSSDFNDGNSQLDPGDTGTFTVTFSNNGGRSLTNASGVLRSLDSHVTVNDSLGDFGAVAIGASDTNAGNPFDISASWLTVGGYAATMQLVVTDTDGFRDSTNFVQIVGVATPTTPTGPDAYGYYAYDNTETQPAGTASQYLWEEVVPNLGGQGTSLGFTDGFEDEDQVAVRPLPFDFTFYGETFDEVTICTNGWLAFGSQTIWDFRNYHIGGPIGPANQIAAYWDDLIVTGIAEGGVYTWYDAATSRYIVEWRSRGLWSGIDEVFEIILYDPVVYPSPTGDGKIAVMYQTLNPSSNPGFNDNDYASVGIQNTDHSIGLEYCYWNTYTPGSATLADGRSIMYTTDVTGAIPMDLSLIAPNGGELWFRDSTASVTWLGGEIGDFIRIELSRNGILGPWEVLTASTPNDGLFDWTVSGTSAQTCRVQITSTSDPLDTDVSAGDFTIAVVQTIYAEDFEDSAPDWTHQSAGGQWVDNWHVSTERAQSGVRSYKCGDVGTGTYAMFNDARLLSPEIVNLPADARLQFSYQIEGELSGAFPDSAYDGGILEISTDGSTFAPITPDGGYPKTFRLSRGGGLPAQGPMPGQPCFSGNVVAWTDVTADLAAFTGQDVRLRFRFGSDSLNYFEGWYVDDVVIFAPSVITEPVTPTGVTLFYYEGNLVLRWDDDSNTHYRIYSGSSPDNALETLEGSTQTNQFTIPGGPSALKRFYTVVGWDGN